MADLHHLPLDPFYWMDRDPFPVRWLRFFVEKTGLSYVRFSGEERDFWIAAMQNAPFAFRWFGRSLSFSSLDAQYNHFDQWLAARKLYREGDKIWPFVINTNSMAMRVGFVIVRGARPITGIVTLIS